MGMQTEVTEPPGLPDGIGGVGAVGKGRDAAGKAGVSPRTNTIGKEALWERYFCFLFCYLTTILLVELLTRAESHPGQG